MESDRIVRDWMDKDEVGSVTSEVSRVGSEFEAFDEDAFVLRDVVEPVAEAADKDEFEAVSAALSEVAQVAQRRSVGMLHRQYTRARMLDYPDYTVRKEVQQRFFKVDGFLQLSSLDDNALISRLMAGVVRSRVSMATGMGKTRKLPGLIASKCGLRVCQLELDNVVATDASRFQKKHYGIAGGVKSWCREKKAYITVMTYHEFRGIVLSGSCAQLFNDFDVFYMDESHVPYAVVVAAMQYFASFSQPHNSLLVVSATISTEDTNNDVARKVGKFEHAVKPVSLVEAHESGELYAPEHVVDRMMLLASSDEEVSMARVYYDEYGLDVDVLDTASTEADYVAVVKKYSVETSVVPRVLVASASYGTSYNFPVSYVVTTGTQRVYELDTENNLVAKVVPLMKKELVQHKGRTGRGMATGSGGWVMNNTPLADKQLLASEGIEYYLSLVAAKIKPRPGVLDSVMKVLPRGIDSEVARRVLRCTLPPALTVRYLGSDGRVAGRFVEGLRLFFQLGEPIRKSKDEWPVGYDTWVEEEAGCYYPGDDSASGVMLKVPFRSPEGLKVQMHTITAVSFGLVDVDYWEGYDMEEESSDEEMAIASKPVRKVKPRLPQKPLPRTPGDDVASVASVWQYDADPLAARKRAKRQGMSWTANGDGKAAVTALLRALDSETLGKSLAVPDLVAPENGGMVAYTLPIDEVADVPVKSAGGGKVLLVTKHVHACFMSGEVMAPSAVVDVVKRLSETRSVDRFSKATLFDNWSPAWLCWFNTLGDSMALDALKDAALHSETVKLLDRLYHRFRCEAISVAVSSNYYRAKLSGYFQNRPSLTKFTKAARKGRLPVAQSDAFVSRVLEIKQAYDVAVLSLETVGLFAPGLVTKAQYKLPMRDGKRRMRVIDEDVVGADVDTGGVLDSYKSGWK